jgi:hypothetical protein
MLSLCFVIIAFGHEVVIMSPYLSADLCSAFDLFDSNGSRVVAARRSAGSDRQSSHHVVERGTYAARDCAVFT